VISLSRTTSHSEFGH